MKTNLWIDTDMGNDDIVAISMLCLNQQITIQGISLVNGVSRVDQGYVNIANILSYFGLSLPILKGFSKALIPNSSAFPTLDRERVEKLNLLTGLNIPSKSKSVIKNINDQSVTNIIADNTTILALGPLTNLAMLLKEDKEKFKSKITKIVLMGGGINNGNVPPLRKAEYNIWLDPQAAQIVFNSGIPITMVGMDATSCVPNTKEFVEIVNNIKPKTKLGQVIKAITLGNTSDFDYFYDPLAASILFDPSIVTEKYRGNIQVVLKGDEFGRTIFNNNNDVQVEVVMNVNADKFFELLITLMKK